MTAAQVVKVFAWIRIGFGLSFFAAPGKLARGDDLLMTRSFAVRELIVGVGALTSSDTATWARLGALIDVGDAAAAGIGVRNKVPLARFALLTGLSGLAFEAWAAHRT